EVGRGPALHGEDLGVGEALLVEREGVGVGAAELEAPAVVFVDLARELQRLRPGVGGFDGGGERRLGAGPFRAQRAGALLESGRALLERGRPGLDLRAG